MAHHVFRRGIFGGATSPYAPIVATSPDLLVPLKYASTAADGQILFQDAACTVPVESIGDPVGGVKWDGVIVATQSTDANRPVWQGEARGLSFDATAGQYLITTGAAADYAYLQASGGATISTLLAKDDTTSLGQICGTWTSVNTGISHDINGDQIRLTVDDGASSVNRSSSTGALPDTNEHTVSVAYDSSETRFLVDGSQVDLSSGFANLDGSTPDSTLYIGLNSGSNHWDGGIKILVAYSTPKSNAELADISSDLQAA